MKSNPWIIKCLYKTDFTYIYEMDRGFPGGANGKELPANPGDTGDAGLILELGRSPGGGNGTPFQYSCLEKTMGRGV